MTSVHSTTYPQHTHTYIPQRTHNTLTPTDDCIEDPGTSFVTLTNARVPRSMILSASAALAGFPSRGRGKIAGRRWSSRAPMACSWETASSAHQRFAAALPKRSTALYRSADARLMQCASCIVCFVHASCRQGPHIVMFVQALCSACARLMQCASCSACARLMQTGASFKHLPDLSQ
jgi:hypothetical protein